MGIMPIVKSLYGIPNIPIADADIIVPLGYGWSTAGLPHAAQLTTKAAAEILAQQKNARIIYSDVAYFGEDIMWQEDQAKLRILKEVLTPVAKYHKVCLADPCINSVTEARNIKKVVYGNGLKPKRIVVVCDWPHARSTRLIWRREFPDVEIVTHSVEAEWDDTHLVPAQQSNESWLLQNMLRHAALLTLGSDFVAKKQYKLPATP